MLVRSEAWIGPHGASEDLLQAVPGYGRFLVFLFGWNLAITELNLSLVAGPDLASVLSGVRSEANTAISIITNMSMAVSQIEPAKISSGARL